MNSYRSCSAKGCNNKTKTIAASGLSFFRIPDDIERRRQWLLAIDRKDLLSEKKLSKTKMYIYVCSEHFADADVITTILKRLTTNAVPTGVLPRMIDTRTLVITKNESTNKILIKQETPETTPQVSEPSEDLPESCEEKRTVITCGSNTPFEPTIEIDVLSDQKVKIEVSDPLSLHAQTDSNKPLNKKTQTTSELSKSMPRIRKLREQNKALKMRLRLLSKEYRKIKDIVEKKNKVTSNPDEAADRFTKLVEWQHEVKNRFKGNRYNPEYKDFALNLQSTNPQAYRWLQTILKLPTKRTLQRTRSRIRQDGMEVSLQGCSVSDPPMESVE